MNGLKPNFQAFKTVLIFGLIIHTVSSDKNKPPKCGSADIVIGVDASWSINFPGNHAATKNFEQQVIPFVHKLVDTLDKKRFRTGYFAWATKQETIYTISENYTKQQQLDKIDETPYLATNTWTGDAIKYGVDMLVNHTAEVRPGIPKVLLIMTDGDPFPPNQTGISVEDATLLFLEHGITPIAIGVGDFYKFEGLFNITGKNDSIYIGGFEDLQNTIVEQIEAKSIYFPVYPKPLEVITITEAKNCVRFYCYRDTKDGVDVLFEVHAGSAKAFYSFTHTTEELTVNSNEGYLKDGTLSELPLDNADKGKELCIAVVSGPEPETNVTITCTPHDPDPDPTPGPGKCGKANIVIGVDGSGSINHPDNQDITSYFQTSVLPFVQELTSLLDNNTNYHTGFFVWSNKQREIFSLAETLSTEQKIKKIGRTDYPAGYTWTGNAISFGVKMLQNGTRSKADKILIIMTDGMPFPLKQKHTVAMAIKEVEKENIKAIAVGLGSNFEHEGLIEIAQSKDNTFPGDPDDLVKIADHIKKLICSGSDPVETERSADEDVTETEDNSGETNVDVVEPNKDHVKTQGKNHSNYFCLKDIGEDIEIDLTATKGDAKVYYSFKDKPDTLSKTKNQGTLKMGYNFIEYDNNQANNELCVLVITGNKSDSNSYSIRFNPLINKH